MDHPTPKNIRVSKNTGVLAHYQDRSARATDLIPSDVADQWVQCMAAERISRRIIRLLPPDSIYPRAQNFPQNHSYCEPETPLGLPSAEVHGLQFERPNPQSYAAARRQEALNTVELYAWG